jgi:rare lipoprotein A (peptidoglycan hydrolase)
VLAPPVTSLPTAGARQGGEATWLNTIPTGTCANNAAPMGAAITVTSSSGSTVVCKVVSRGPYGAGRIVDLAEGTFAALAPPSQGVVSVRVGW